MNFWDKLFKRKNTDDKQKSSAVCQLSLCGGEYILSEFDMRYASNNAECEYFEMYVVIEEPIQKALENWITLSGKREDGWVKFYENNDVLDRGAMYEIAFQDACCVRYRKTIHLSQPATTIVMAIPHIKMAGEEYEMKR